MGQAPQGLVGGMSTATLVTARKDITLARSIISTEALAASGPKRASYEAALRHLDLAIAEIDRKLAASRCDRASIAPNGGPDRFSP